MFRYTALRNANVVVSPISPSAAQPSLPSPSIDRELVQRELVARHSVSCSLGNPSVNLECPDYVMVEDHDVVLHRRYVSSQSGAGEQLDLRSNIEDVAFFLPVQLQHGGTTYAELELDVLEVANAAGETFFVNKVGYARLVDHANLGIVGTLLLVAIARAMTRGQHGEPLLSSQVFVDAVRNQLDAAYRRAGETQQSALRKQLVETVSRLGRFDFTSLTSFTIELPAAPTAVVRVAGTFTVEVGTSERVTPASLAHYQLLAEYPSGLTTREERIALVPAPDFESTKGASFVRDLRNVGRGSLSVRVKALDGAVLWSRELELEKDPLDSLDIRVRWVEPVRLGSSVPSASGDVDKKLRGKVIAEDPGRSLSGLAVVVQVQKEVDGRWNVVGVAEVDRGGSFALAYPFGNHVAARAFLAQAPGTSISIAIVPRANATISDEFLFLLLEGQAPAQSVVRAEPGCDCDTKQLAPRLPDHRDLLASGEYTQDVGGCVRLTTPNRTLREYPYRALIRFSDPDVANYTLEKRTEGGTPRFRLHGGTQRATRSPVTLENPIRWQDAPDASSSLSIHQAVSVAVGHVLHYKSVFKSDGYSIGDVLYSVPLAPGQKKQIVTLESSHTLTGAESQFLAQGETLAAALVDDRAVTDVLSGALDESVVGGSSASTSGISAGLGAAGSMGGIGGSLGVSGGFANSNSSASQNSARNVAQFFGERLRQSIIQNSESYRRLNATVVSTVKEGQQYGVTTETIANHNHCHSLTVLYFEILRHYAIFQEISHVEECVFVPLLMTCFTTANIAKWRDVLAKRLLPVPSSTYLTLGRSRPGQHPLLAAFDANERIRTDYAHVDYPPEGTAFADEAISSVQGTMTLRVSLQRPQTRFDRIKSLPMVTETTTREEVDVEGTIKRNAMAVAAGPFGFLFAGSESRNVEEDRIVVGKIFDQFMELDANYRTVPPARCIRVTSFKEHDVTAADGTKMHVTNEFFAEGSEDLRLWSAYAAILAIDKSTMYDVYDMLEEYFAGRLIAEWDDIFYGEIVPAVFDKLLKTMKVAPFAFDVTPLDSYRGGDRRVRLRLRCGRTSQIRRELMELRIHSTSDEVRKLYGGAVVLNVEELRLDYDTDHFHGVLFNGFVGDDLHDGVFVQVPLTPADKRDPRREDRFVVSQLIEHLNSNLEHYNKLLWSSLDPDRRFALLDGFDIVTYSDDGGEAPPRSLASVVKNELVAITGNSLVFPVAAGYRVNRSYLVEGDDPGQGLLDHYRPSSPIPPFRISVPTRGSYAEVIQGACDACEKVEPNTSQDWTKFGTDEPTPIMPVAPATPVVTDWRAAFKDFASPLVSIQNAPSAPAPGAGLTGLSDLLGKSDTFKDITGLQGNQSNAMATYQSNQDNVRAMAQMAQSLAMQQHNTANSQAIIDRIRQARERGTISSSEESELVRRHLGQQVDGGSSERDAARTERERQRPSIMPSASSAAQEGRSVRATRADADGTVESVEIGGASGLAPDRPIDVAHNVDPRRQPQSPANACWATAATMLYDWKNHTSSEIEEVLREAGRRLVPAEEDRFVSLYRAGAGLPADQKAAFVGALGLQAESPASYGIEQYVSWLDTYGPLWLTTDAAPDEQFSPHARILVRIAGPNVSESGAMMFTFIDPATGLSVTESFTNFVASFEQMASDTRGPLRPQVVHFREPFSAGEGDGRSYQVPPNVWDWGYLIRFESPVALPSDFSLQLVSQSLGVGTNLDLYEEEIVEFPTVDGVRLTAPDLLEYVRTHLNEIIARGGDSITFTPVHDAERWTSADPLGVILDIAITMDSGYVVVSHFEAGSRWIFSTVRGPLLGSGSHPVSGNREFGIYRDGGGSGRWVFYTRGVDRANVPAEMEQTAFDGGHELWMSVLRGVRRFIDEMGGVAFSRLPPTRHNIVWDRLDDSLPPTIPIPPAGFRAAGG